MAKQIVIDHVFKVFGDDPQEALALVRQGLSKQEVLARTGQSIGVFDAHLSIEAGEIFVGWTSRSCPTRNCERCVAKTSAWCSSRLP